MLCEVTVNQIHQKIEKYLNVRIVTNVNSLTLDKNWLHIPAACVNAGTTLRWKDMRRHIIQEMISKVPKHVEMPQMQLVENVVE